MYVYTVGRPEADYYGGSGWWSPPREKEQSTIPAGLTALLARMRTPLLRLKVAECNVQSRFSMRHEPLPIFEAFIDIGD